ncbi:MAG: GDP-mannose 4,6-dehydratase [Candidatus Omnitrophica bacterium]|nr:GDP-mannose 4,6-dehydratase [Candidatus Omnitrophota bacterium]
MKRAIVVGCEGQDGRLLTGLLMRKKYEVLSIDKGIARSTGRLRFKAVDISSAKDVRQAVKRFRPDEIYYLAAFHHSSEDAPIENLELSAQSYKVNVFSLINFLEAIKEASPATRLFYAASSHIFGNARSRIQDENTPINPVSIYGITKAAGLFICRFYRERYSVFVSAGILYNHESSLRGEKFISRKIIKGAMDIRKGRRKKIVLGDLSSTEDFGYAPDYVEAMHKILNIADSGDFIIATGKGHSVLDFVKVTFGFLGLDWKQHVREDRRVLARQRYHLIGNPAKLRSMTSWKPSVDFRGMIRLLLAEEGFLGNER